MISIIDDDASVRHGTANLLQSLGYDVVTFASAEEFLDSDQAEATACVISDVNMPGLSGLDLQQLLIDDGRCLPIIFITAFFSETTRAQALAAGAIGFLSKPYHEASLIQCLDTALNRSGRQSSD